MGFGGAHLHPRTGLETPYLSEEFMDRIKGCLAKAKQGKSQVFCMMRIVGHPDLREVFVTKGRKNTVRSIFCLQTSLMKQGKRYRCRQIQRESSKNLNGRLLEVYDVVLDEKGYLVSGKKLEEGMQSQGTCWYAYLERPLPSTWYNHQTYVNTLDKAAMDRFLEITHEAYAKRDRGRVWKNGADDLYG